MAKKCVNCSFFDSSDEYCDKYDISVDPDDECIDADSLGQNYRRIDRYRPNKLCATCTKFDPNFEGGYCDYYNCPTKASNSCNAHFS